MDKKQLIITIIIISILGLLFLILGGWLISKGVNLTQHPPGNSSVWQKEIKEGKALRDVGIILILLFFGFVGIDLALGLKLDHLMHYPQIKAALQESSEWQ